MSHLYLKSKYSTEGSYGSTEEKVIYCHHNNNSDYVIFYDEDGEILLIVCDTIKNNILDVINKLYSPIDDSGDKQALKEGIERMTSNDRHKCNI